MGLEMIEIKTDFRLGMKYKALILFFGGFVGIKGKGNFGTWGLRLSSVEISMGQGR